MKLLQLVASFYIVIEQAGLSSPANFSHDARSKVLTVTVDDGNETQAEFADDAEATCIGNGVFYAESNGVLEGGEATEYKFVAYKRVDWERLKLVEDVRDAEADLDGADDREEARDCQDALNDAWQALRDHDAKGVIVN